MSFDNRSVVAGHKIAFRLHKLQNFRFDTTFDLEIRSYRIVNLCANKYIRSNSDISRHLVPELVGKLRVIFTTFLSVLGFYSRNRIKRAPHWTDRWMECVWSLKGWVTHTANIGHIITANNIINSVAYEIAYRTSTYLVFSEASNILVSQSYGNAA